MGDTQRAEAQIAKRAADDEKNAFIEAQKDKNSDLGQAVEQQKDAEKKAAAALDSLAKAKTEYESSKTRTANENGIVAAELKKQRALLKQNSERHKALEAKLKQVNSELELE